MKLTSDEIRAIWRFYDPKAATHLYSSLRPDEIVANMRDRQPWESPGDVLATAIRDVAETLGYNRYGTESIADYVEASRNDPDDVRRRIEDVYENLNPRQGALVGETMAYTDGTTAYLIGYTIGKSRGTLLHAHSNPVRKETS